MVEGGELEDSVADLEKRGVSVGNCGSPTARTYLALKRLGSANQVVSGVDGVRVGVGSRRVTRFSVAKSRRVETVENDVEGKGSVNSSLENVDDTGITLKRIRRESFKFKANKGSDGKGEDGVGSLEILESDVSGLGKRKGSIVKVYESNKKKKNGVVDQKRVLASGKRSPVANGTSGSSVPRGNGQSVNDKFAACLALSKRLSRLASPSKRGKEEKIEASPKKVNIEETLSYGKSGTAKKVGRPLVKKTAKSDLSGRREEKDKIRCQIKDMLLSSGWRIDLRPRRNRNYLDSVYISPQGTGYWSITKAYDVFRKESKDGIKSPEFNKVAENQPIQSNRRKEGLNCLTSNCAPISTELLGLLKKNIVHRRSKKELQEEEDDKKYGCNGTRKPREATRIKFVKKTGGVIASRSKKSSTNESHLISGRKKKNQRGCTLLGRNSFKGSKSGGDDYILYEGKRTVLSLMIDLGIVPVNGKVKYANSETIDSNGAFKGSIDRDGIQCSCCNNFFALSEFEIHAGGDPGGSSQHIILEESGISLLQCQFNAWKSLVESEVGGFSFVEISDDDPNDDTCGICGDGGDLICCDDCPSTFHLGCLGMENLPAGEWHCSNCTCRLCGAVDRTNAQADISSSSLLTCRQCEEKYHLSCVMDDDKVPADDQNLCKLYCGKSCLKLFAKLSELLGVRNKLEDGFSWSIVQRFDHEGLSPPLEFVREAECNAKVAVALSVMDECFLPIVDQRSGVDLVRHVVYNCGSNFSRLNYSGFYTFLLEKNEELISAASVRFHGTRVAEMPFIGTRIMYRNQGMCRRLLNAIESVLSSLNIAKLVIPAISELVHTWTTVFGFEPLTDSYKQEIKSVNIMVFPGTGLLVKDMTEMEENAVADRGTKIEEAEADQNHMLVEANDSSKQSSFRSDCVIENGIHHADKDEPRMGVVLDSIQNGEASLAQSPLVSDNTTQNDIEHSIETNEYGKGVGHYPCNMKNGDNVVLSEHESTLDSGEPTSES